MSKYGINAGRPGLLRVEQIRARSVVSQFLNCSFGPMHHAVHTQEAPTDWIETSPDLTTLVEYERACSL